MREDMAHVVVERPRLKPYNIRKGRSVSLKDMPSHEGMRRGHALQGDRKQLNENLAPLRRYLEKQVGRPWSKVYSEIARHLRIDSTVQQHVRDHIEDFVAVKPRRIAKSWPSSHAWWQPLYVDPVTGILCRTDKLPEEKTRRHARLNRPAPPIEHVPLGKDDELRLIDGQWYHVKLAPLPEAVYRVRREIQTRHRSPYSVRRHIYEVEMDVRRLITPDVWDVVEKRFIPVGPKLDDENNWREYRREHPSTTYAVARRTLSHRELRRHDLANASPDETRQT
jgi:hypothetical protein